MSVAAGGVVPAVGLTVSQGTSAGESQAVSSSTMFQFKAMLPLLVMVNGCVVCRSVFWVAARLSGYTSMIGASTVTVAESVSKATSVGPGL